MRSPQVTRGPSIMAEQTGRHAGVVHSHVYTEVAMVGSHSRTLILGKHSDSQTTALLNLILLMNYLLCVKGVVHPKSREKSYIIVCYVIWRGFQPAEISPVSQRPSTMGLDGYMFVELEPSKIYMWRTQHQQLFPNLMSWIITIIHNPWQEKFHGIISCQKTLATLDLYMNCSFKRNIMYIKNE